MGILAAFIIIVIVGGIGLIGELAGPAQWILQIYTFLATWLHSIVGVLAIVTCLYILFVQKGIGKRILNTFRLCGVVSLIFLLRDLTVVFKGLSDNILHSTVKYASITTNIPILANTIGLSVISFIVFILLLGIICNLSTIGSEYVFD